MQSRNTGVLEHCVPATHAATRGGGGEHHPSAPLVAQRFASVPLRFRLTLQPASSQLLFLKGFPLCNLQHRGIRDGGNIRRRSSNTRRRGAGEGRGGPSTRLLLLFLRYGTQRGLISQSGGAPPRVFSIASSRNLADQATISDVGSRFLSHVAKRALE